MYETAKETLMNRKKKKKNVIFVTGSFMYQLETGAQIKHYFWVCLQGFFQMKLAIELVDSVEQIAVLYVNDYYSIR